MAFEKFDDTKFRPAGEKTIKQANEIIRDYQNQGLKLTVRQLYYRFVAKGLIENTFRSYKNLAATIDAGRRRGLIDWSAIEDRTRNLEAPNTWSSPEQIMRAVASQYMENPWNEQDHYVEVWVEKEALVGVIESACEDLRVPFLACRGYLSQSEAYDAGKRFQRINREGRKPIIFHLGDHDPSGLDMTRDNAARVQEYAKGEVEVVRLALNREQIDEYDPPPNPAKETDSRFDTYRAEHGDESWELDALEPNVIIDLVKDAIQEKIDQDKWDDFIEREEERKEILEGITNHWDRVGLYLRFREDEILEDIPSHYSPDDVLDTMKSRADDEEEE